MRKVIAVGIAVLFSACGAGLDGTYKDQMGVSSYTFKSGKVIVSVMGIGSEMDYKVEDGKVKIITPQGTMIMNILKDGSIEGPLGINLSKQKE
jgi:hypothetical protein